MLAGVNDLATVGAPSATSVSVAAVALVPAFVVVSAPDAIVFTSEPDAVGVTLTVTVQLPLAGMVPALNATLLPPAVAVTVPAHPAPLIVPAGVAVFTRLAG